MFEKLPSLLGLNPRFYTGGPTRFHLPLLYDLVASKKPRSIVALGFGDGQAFFALCQAAREHDVECQYVALRREDTAEKEADDVAWLQGKDYGDEFYRDLVRFRNSSNAAMEFADQSLDLLLLDDCDSGAQIRADLSIWGPKLSPNGLVLFHGVALERADDPRAAWLEWTGSKLSVEFPDGIGLAIALQSKTAQSQELLLQQLFGGKEALAELVVAYRLAVARIEAQARADEAVRAQAALEARQIWLDSLLADRWKIQEIMDHQMRAIAQLEARMQLALDSQAEQQKNFELLHRDRVKAQLVMDAQAEQLKSWIRTLEQLKAERDKLKAQVKEQKQILKFAKDACRKKGRCFQLPGTVTEKKPRSFSERVSREIQRARRNFLGGGKAAEPDSKPESQAVRKSEAETSADRYRTWIADHEPTSTALESQRESSQRWVGPKISLLVPVLDTPGNFLEEMFSSVAQQTYPNWELCLVDAGSTQIGTLQVLDNWVAREPRIQFERLEANLGIAENTNRALQLATGDFIGCLDHDDLLAPFALYEIARAISGSPAADIFYSDEDRWSEQGIRHTPFFKPEWSPEFLYSCMYLGHLTVYRRNLANTLGGFRKAFDLSQDYDFALRATEQARAVCHVPGVLYHWREHPASGSAGGKPEARLTNLAALADAMERRGLPAEIIEYPTANRVRLKISKWRKVSIIIPTDSAERSRLCVEELPRMTSYPNYEIVIVTNSSLAKLLEVAAPKNPVFRFVRYDKPFNFSDKCNVGAQAATGDHLIFFNDDVESGQRDWIQNLIEPLENPDVGAVAPKLLYATGRIQHAGLVTGVRGLVGTACHEWPGDSSDYTNFAQSMRDVSALSAACLAIRREDFFRVGEFDAVNAPIAHSDVDLCFKIREAGLRCVYTPFATMTHRGHVSIGAAEQQKPPVRDKASVYLLKRWGGYICRDPYYPDDMRDWLYADSPTPIRMFGKDDPDSSRESHDLLFFSHDLSLSGAPILLLHLAIWCKNNGIFVVVMAPEDGPLREKYQAAGIPLIVDPLITTGHESFTKFAGEFDCILANTIRSEPVVRSAHSAHVPVIWWMHETLVGEHYLQGEATLRSSLALADVILAPTERTASVYRPFTEFPVKHLLYGIPEVVAQSGGSQDHASRPVRFLVLGSIEPRKGQDIFVKAVASLSAEARRSAEFHLLGRIMDPEFGASVEAAASKLENFSIDHARDHGEALDALRGIDVLVCSSRDEAMPVTILEALSLGKAIISTKVGGIGEILMDGHDALLVKPEDPEALASAMERLINDPELARRLSQNARETFAKNFTLNRFGADFRALVDQVTARPSLVVVESAPELLFVSHDLSLSGAPMMLFYAARWCHQNGISVQVMVQEDGPLSDKLKVEGIPLTLDPLIESRPEAFAEFAGKFDCIVANTIRTGAVVRAMQEKNVPIAWWLHEPQSVAEHYIRGDAKLRATLPLADMLFAPSEGTAAAYRAFTERPVKCLRNAIPDLRPEGWGNNRAASQPLRFLHLGSIEARKGQDILVQALALLPRELQEAAQFQVAGRILDLDFWSKVEAIAATVRNFSARGALDHRGAIELMNEADVVISSSRDEAMPTVTILEAMCLGKALIATTVRDAREVMVEGENSLLVKPEDPDALAAAIRRLIEDPTLISELGEKARGTYERDFTMERFGKEFRKLIDEVIAAKTARSRKRST
jgi:glycosyltransferase involved in cell wall biosynthesis/cellulose synthase/poly-beta-1,6-N-acetylglucosamine synthase-like glycosyltransferase